MDPMPLPEQDPWQRDPLLDTPVEYMDDFELEVAQQMGNPTVAGLASKEKAIRLVEQAAREEQE